MMLLKGRENRSQALVPGGSRQRRRGRKEDSSSWAVSYVDMLTLLLCFFIIFYNINPKGGANGLGKSLQKIALEIQSKSGGDVITGQTGSAGNEDASGKGAGYGSVDGFGKGIAGFGNSLFATGSATTTFGSSSKSGFFDTTSFPHSHAESKEQITEQLKTGISSLSSVKGQMKSEVLEVNFNGVSFFDTASVRLRPEALKTVQKVIQMLQPWKDSIHITVQGHTDARTVAIKRTKFADNWELSVLRATAVLKYFATAGFPPQNLSAEGIAGNFAGSRGPTSAAVSEQELANQRKVTLRIEAR